ncbi:MAG: HU family DNA-binding protein [Rhodobacteraceae bacterium]|jgi:nucleoid DNA-binding protein|nr:HU family DNA-binding protein [Paracoccaceae bacterium]
MATSTAKKKTTTPKSPAAKAAASKPAVKASVSAPKVAVPDMPALAPEAEGAVIEKAPKTIAPQLKKKDLVARVVAALDGKKKGQVKEIVEATLATLGEALAKGESLNLPPFGRARIARQKGEGKTSAMTVKLRGAGEKNAPKAPKQALAEAGEDD